MRIFNRLAILPTLAALAAAAVSCHDGAEWLTPDSERRIEVSINAPSTRTALLEDGLTARWVRGDRIALWAYADGNAAFAGVPFTLWYPREDPEQGLFTGKIDAMAAGTYDYYASYPTPEAAEGTKVSYTIPTVQNGTWNGDLDIMLAAAQGAELKEEILNEITLQFRHKIHALKITIPEGRNLLGRPIEKLRIEFPQPVAGRLTWDLAHPEAAPETAATDNAITLDFAEPVDAGDTFWVFIAPADLTGGEVKFVATDGAEYSWPLSAWNFRDCAAGRITPVRLTIDERRPQQDYRLTIDPAHLGEPVTQIDSLTMPAGYEFPSLELHNTTNAFKANEDGTFTLRIFNDQPFADNIEVGMTVGSENTEGVHGKHCEISNVTADGCTVAAPYLFFEDFSEAIGHDAYADKDGDQAYELSEAGLPGWTGSRWKTEAATSLELRTYIGTAASGMLGSQYGRVDSPTLPIKNEKTINIIVHYDIGATVNYGSSTNTSKIHANCIFGSTTESGAIAGGKNSSHNYPSNKIDEYILSNNGTPDNRPTIKKTSISGVTDKTRLSWFGYYNRESGSFIFVTQATFYYYIGNIRVTISH